jgi:alginate O-acetyltransferase complex protein AlgI
VLFNSWQFAIFFPFCVLAFFSLPHRFRWAWLLVSSIFFYAVYIPEYILILFLTIIVDYLAGIWIERSTGTKRKFFLWMSIIVTCAILFFFKYYNFVLQSILQIFDIPSGVAARSSFPLPIGLSFHTFQSLSYVIEVYRGRQKAERHLGIYSVYVLFFPQLVAGPIERPQNLLHQFREYKKFDVYRASSGLFLVAWGLFQKTVVADRLGVIVDYVYDAYGSAPASAHLLASIFFAFQIYADFQGYSNVARGTARILGFDLMKNFNRPYGAASVTEFWRRWHISLSTWFRDYLYFPLGGGKGGPIRVARNLLITFLVSGLWHGANWTFVIWGMLNGAWVVLERWTHLPEKTARLIKPFPQILTFMMVLVTWVFFRARSIEAAFDILSSFPVGLVDVFSNFGTDAFFAGLGSSPVNFYLAVVAIAGMLFFEKYEMPTDLGITIRQRPTAIRWCAYVGVVTVVVLSWIYFPASAKPFIYFQF